MSALNQLYSNKEKVDPIAAHPINDSSRKENIFTKDLDEAKQHLLDLSTTSNHYCIVESEHPYKSSSISTFRVEFPPSVQWFTVEFDQQCGTAQPEDYLIVSIPNRATNPINLIPPSPTITNLVDNMQNDKFSVCRNAYISTSVTTNKDDDGFPKKIVEDNDSFIIKMYNRYTMMLLISEIIYYKCCFFIIIFRSPSMWSQSALVLPGNRIDFSLETASNYARDQQANKYGFRCLIVGYENPSVVSFFLEFQL